MLEVEPTGRHTGNGRNAGGSGHIVSPTSGRHLVYKCAEMLKGALLEVAVYYHREGFSPHVPLYPSQCCNTQGSVQLRGDDVTHRTMKCNVTGVINVGYLLAARPGLCLCTEAKT